jgi:hypothetical protein
LLLAGCSTQATLTINSTPEGAYITEVGKGGKAYGVTPVTVYYDRSNLKYTKNYEGCYSVRGFEAHWVSGATATLVRTHLCGSDTGDYTLTFTRDPSAPGFAQDMQFAVQLQQLRAQQRQAQAAEEAADAALFQAASPQRNTYMCTAMQTGNLVTANCN